jgi:hypothetical protein
LIDARDPVTLARVVEPLPVKVRGRNDPGAERKSGGDGAGDHDQGQPDDQKLILLKAFFVKGQTAERSDDMRRTQEPDVDHKDDQERLGKKHDERAGGERKYAHEQDERQVEGRILKPVIGIPGDGGRSFLHK